MSTARNCFKNSESFAISVRVLVVYNKSIFASFTYCAFRACVKINDMFHIVVIFCVEFDPFQSKTFAMGELGFGLCSSDKREIGADPASIILGAGVLGAQRDEGSLWETAGFGETCEASFGRVGELISCMDNSL